MNIAAAFRRAIDALEAKAPRAVWMAVPCIVGFQFWRVLPNQSPLAPPVYVAGGLLILLAMKAFRYRVPDAAFTIVAALALLSAFCMAQGEPELARVMGGGMIVTLLVSAAGAIEEPMDKPLAIGQGLTLLWWFAGNCARGTFGPEVARSAAGQAYGAFAEPLLLVAIMTVYVVSWYNLQKEH